LESSPNSVVEGEMTAEQYLLAAVGTALIIVGVFRVTERGTVLKRLSYKFNSLGALLITAGVGLLLALAFLRS
jgi:hypothetical protein